MSWEPVIVLNKTNRSFLCKLLCFNDLNTVNLQCGFLVPLSLNDVHLKEMFIPTLFSHNSIYPNFIRHYSPLFLERKRIDSQDLYIIKAYVGQ